jgi:hypothetical protein
MYHSRVKTGSVIIGLVAAIFMSVSIGCFISGGSVRKEEAVPEELASAVRAAWMNIGSSGSRCDEYDYFPHGGMRNFYCHAMQYIAYKRFAALVGVPVFISGPHTAAALVLDSEFSFGRYNPEFVVRLSSILIPGDRDRVFRTATQGVYNSAIRPLARIFFVTYRKLMDNPGYIEQEKKTYIDAIRERKLKRYDYEKYFDFLDCDYPVDKEDNTDFAAPSFNGRCDGNVVKTCVAFWIRRSIDGTADEFYAGLKKLLKAYDDEFLKSYGPL